MLSFHPGTCPGPGPGTPRFLKAPLGLGLGCAVLSWLCLCLLVAAPQTVQAEPTAEQQYWLELVNRARRDPAGELERLVNYASPSSFASPASDDPDVANSLAFFGTSASQLLADWAGLSAAPPLAWVDSLASSATGYSQLMYDLDEQSHSLDGLSLEDRIGASGYMNVNDYLELGENLFAATESITHGHAGFLIDWGDSDTNPGNGYGNGLQNPASHRDLLYDPAFKEIGIAWINADPFTSNVIANGPLVVTQHLGSRYRQTGPGSFRSDAIVTGVIFADTVFGDAFYTPGEGLAGVAVEIYNQSTGVLLASGLSNGAGGYSISLLGAAAGTSLRISAPSTGLPDQFTTLTGHVTDPSLYGAPVTIVDNQYAAFMMVPEPSGLLLAFLGAALALAQRRRGGRIAA